jgi:hypothetical protein
MDNNEQNLEVQNLAPLEGALPVERENPEETISSSFAKSSEDEQVRIDALLAHDIKADVVNLGQIENLESISPEAPVADKTAEVSDSFTLSKSKILMIKKIAQNLRDSASQLVELLSIVAEDEVKIKTGQLGEVQREGAASASIFGEPRQSEGSVVEGVFDGEKMVGPDGKTYVVPVNYASKSRLVEGDTLKLIITDTGTFIYKQINPIERRRLVGTLDEGDNGEYYVIADDRRWRVLPASITYYKGETGDEVVILIPKAGMSRWAAVENVVKR